MGLVRGGEVDFLRGVYDLEKLDRYLTKIGDFLDVMIYILGGGGLVLAIMVYAFNIFDWWLFGRRVAVADEIALMGLVWVSYVGMGLLFRHGGHCTMNFVVEMCPERWRPPLDIVRDLMILAVSIFAVYYSWKLSIRSLTKLLTISKIPYFYCDICFTIGYGHLLLVVLVDLLHNIVKLFTGKKGGVAK